LSIVCILMLVSTPVREERSDWRDMYGEKKRAKDRALSQMEIVYD